MVPSGETAVKWQLAWDMSFKIRLEMDKHTMTNPAFMLLIAAYAILFISLQVAFQADWQGIKWLSLNMWVAIIIFISALFKKKELANSFLYAAILFNFINGAIFVIVMRGETNLDILSIIWRSDFLVEMVIPAILWSMAAAWSGRFYENQIQDNPKVDTNFSNSLVANSLSRSSEKEEIKPVKIKEKNKSNKAKFMNRNLIESEEEIPKNAKIALDHREEFTKEWPKIKSLGGEWIRTFTGKLDGNPNSDLFELVEATSLELQETYPYRDEMVASLYDDLCEKTQHLSNQTDILREFREATYIILETTSVEEIYKSILEKSGIFPARRLVFYGRFGEERPIEVYHGNILKIMSASRDKREFYNLNALFTYLGKKPKFYCLGKDIFFKELPNSSIILIDDENHEDLDRRYINFQHLVESVGDNIGELKIIS